MEAKEKIDLIKAKADIAKSKLMAFLAIAGGSWIYGLKDNLSILFFIALWISFALFGLGAMLNLLKLGKFENELREIENG